MSKSWNSSLNRSDPETIRAWKRRSQGLQRSGPIKPVNRERRERNWEDYYGSVERVKAIQRLSCLACGSTPSQNAHVRSRAAGGTWKDVVPLCGKCHTEQHQVGVETFQERRGLDLEAEAARLAREVPARPATD